jgi:hypothetical protein
MTRSPGKALAGGVVAVLALAPTLVAQQIFDTVQVRTERGADGL